jgi:hypothetical protein
MNESPEVPPYSGFDRNHPPKQWLHLDVGRDPAGIGEKKDELGICHLALAARNAILVAIQTE